MKWQVRTLTAAEWKQTLQAFVQLANYFLARTLSFTTKFCCYLRANCAHNICLNTQHMYLPHVTRQYTSPHIRPAWKQLVINVLFLSPCTTQPSKPRLWLAKTREKLDLTVHAQVIQCGSKNRSSYSNGTQLIPHVGNSSPLVSSASITVNVTCH